VKTPTWAEVEEFLKADRWEEVRDTGHRFYRKTLADGRVLETHRSFASNKTMSAGRFALILRTQLECSAEAFWDSIRTKRPVARPSAPPAAPPQHPLWAVRVLRDELHLSADEIAAMPADEVMRRAQEHWSDQG
jgi:hypothetical protein